MKTGYKGTRVLSLLCGCLTGVALSAAVQSDEKAFGGGSGTETDPYQIGTVRQLQAMKDNLSAHYVLVNDIAAADAATWDGGKGFTPVGDPAHPFEGTFDGRGHTIDDLRIDRFGQITTHIGLFGITGEKALIRNVHVRKAFVKGCDCVGALVGVNQGTISHCYVSGEVYGSGTFGGLVGGNNKGRIEHCAAAVNVGPVWVGNHLGGLVGSHNGGEISDCFATGTVTGQENPGGLVGVNNGGAIRRCYASGNVSSSFGGASDSYRRGAGGLVAQNSGGGTISDCFATGKVTAPGGLPAGGLLGFNTDQGAVSNSYYLADRATPSPGVGKNYPDAGRADCENVAEIGPSFFEAGKGPLGGWATAHDWTWDRGSGAATLPCFRNSFGSGRQGEASSGESAKPTVVADLADGSCIVGRPVIADLMLVSPLGKINVPLASVAQVVFKADQETATVSLGNGDRLSGVVDMTSLDLEAVWGKASIPLQHMRTLTVRGGLVTGTTPFDRSGVVK